MRLFCAMFLALLPSAAHAWVKIESPHFIVYGSASEDRTRRFTEHVEKFDALLRKMNGLAPDDAPPVKLTIFIVPSVSAVRKQIQGDSSNVAGYYNAVITGPYAVVPASAGDGGTFDLNAETILFHEYAHHFMLQYFAVGYAPWFVEGFAEYWSTAVFRSDGGVDAGMPARFRFYDLVRAAPFPMKRMFSADFGRMTEDDTSRFYAWSWLLTHYLYLSPERKGQLNTYIKAFAEGKPATVAATTAFGDIEQLQKDLVKYRDASRIAYLKLKSFSVAAPAMTVTPLDAAQSAMMPLFIRFTRGSNGPDEVAAFAADARSNATRFPGNAMALELLAEGELDAKQFEAATKANDALLAARPDDARALLRRARIAAASLQGGGDALAWKTVRQLVVKANHANPNDPFPLLMNFETYRQSGVMPPQLAIDGLRRAQELAPQVGSLRFMLASIYMRQDKKDFATAVLAPMLNEPHSAQARAEARALLDDSIPVTIPDLGSDDESGKKGK